ncbi:MAG: PEGA domain-containing protein [Chloracidobacterium sp.]|uniref:PEGA domain-containing protein n=1 Tax=Chloracidobacterium validum TaxID=2821543 RepID=A0ABX8B735_9BACT|nr:PEGA domain-containing protein [Chloracidobacterium validum]QUW02768.1 PEGA domain-containing protein [Chloracidobacterium validum]
MTTTHWTQTRLQSAFTKRGKLSRLATGLTVFLLVVVLVGTGILLYIRHPATMGKLDVVTTPPGAEVWLDGRRIGTAPCTIERVGLGLHTLRAVHEGFILAEREVLVEEKDTAAAVSFVLQPVKADLQPSPARDGAPTERIAEFMQQAAEAFRRGDLVTPANDNALYYSDAVLLIQPDNEPARALRARIRDTLARQAELAAGRGDLAAAQAAYATLLSRFPSDEQSKSGINRIADLIEANRGRATRFLALAEAALANGHYLDPPQANAYFYLSQVLAHDRGQSQAQRLRAEVRHAAQSTAERYVAQGDLARATAEYRRLARLFPEDRALYNRLRQLERQQAPKDNQTVSAVSLPAARQLTGRQSSQVSQAGTLRFSATGLVFAAPSGMESLSIATEDIARLQASRTQLTVTLTDGRVYRFTGTELERGAAVWRNLRNLSTSPHPLPGEHLESPRNPYE